MDVIMRIQLESRRLQEQANSGTSFLISMKDFISNGKGRRILKPKEAVINYLQQIILNSKIAGVIHSIDTKIGILCQQLRFILLQIERHCSFNSVCRRQFARLTASSPFPQAKLRAEGRHPLAKYYESNLLGVVAH
jgi:hypothetical protein